MKRVKAMKRSVLMTLLAGICAVSICGCGQDAGGQELEAQKGETQEQFVSSFASSAYSSQDI